MLVFNLKNFPNVCRLCLQPKSSAELITLDSYRPLYGCTVMEMLEEMSFKISLELACYLPMEICEECLDMFEFFCKYRRKLNLIQRFACSLAEIKCGNQEPMIELFENERNQLQVLFKDLDICQQEDVGAAELIEEFPQYDLASIICVKIETDNEGANVTTLITEVPEGKSICSEDLDSKDQSSFIREFQKALEEQQNELIEFEIEETKVQPSPETDDDSRSEYTVIEGDEQIGIAQDLGDFSNEPAAKRKRRVRLLEEEVELQECDLDCNFNTTYATHFEKHLEKMHSDKLEILSCHRKSCHGELFDTLDLLRQHKNDVHSTHICFLCGKTVKHLVALENHLKRHDRMRTPMVQCTMCDEVFRTETEVQKHAVKVHSVRFSFECPECGLGFKQKLLLTQHLLTHSVERNFNCKQCGRGFKTSNHLRRHVRTVHVEVRYTCDHCPVSYGRRDKLRMHMERAHDIQTYFVCDICCVSFETNDKLEEHLLRHEQPKMLECGMCLHECTNPEEYNEHLCITYQEDYVCCDRDFRYHSYYNRHMFLAHGVKTNARVKPKTGVLMGKQRALRKPVERCPKCEQVFATRKLKKEHMETCAGQVVIFEIEPVANENAEV